MNDVVDDLAYLHRWHLNGNGRPFHVGPNEQTFKDTGLDAQSYDRAKGRLFVKQLGKPMGTGGLMTITLRGVDVVEDGDALELALPVAPRTRRPVDVPRDVADSLAEVRATALDFVSDDDLRAIIERDLAELSAALEAGLHKSTALLAGSITEALLVDVLDRRRDMAVAASPALAGDGAQYPDHALVHLGGRRVEQPPGLVPRGRQVAGGAEQLPGRDAERLRESLDRRHVTFNLLSDRYERGSVLVTTNLAFAEWLKVFGGDEKLTMVLLD